MNIRTVLAQFSIRNKTKPILVVCMFVTFGLFLSLVDSQKKNTDPTYIRNQLLEQGKIRELKEWKVTFEACNTQKGCEVIGTPDIKITLPDPDGIAKIVAQLPAKPTVAKIKYEPTFEDRQWMSKYRDTLLVLVMPRMVQEFTESMITHSLDTFDERSRHGYGSSPNFSISANILLSRTDLRFQVYFPAYDFFGPIDAPIALVEPEFATMYTESQSSLATISSFLSKQMDIGVPLLLTCIALILDHSRVFSVLSFLAVARAIRYFLSFDLGLPDPSIPIYIPMTVGNHVVDFPFAESLVVLVNIVTLATLVYFSCQIFQIRIRRRITLFSLGFLVLAAFLALWLDPSFAVKSDLWSDILGSVISIPIVAFGVQAHLRKRQEFNNEVEREMYATASISSFLYWLRVALITGALVITFWVNASDLFELSNNYFKDHLNWAHGALLPILIVASLLEIGSTTKKMRTFSEVMVAKALIDRDLQVGKEIQETLLPVRRGNNSVWGWRAFYYPAVTLAGDWFDIQQVRFKDGKEMLLLCLADVTGHGIGAALITTTISSHWSIWVESLRDRCAPATDTERESLLVEGPERIHRGLIALRRNSGCTAGFILLDNLEGRMTYCIAGHPGIITQKPGETRMGFYSTPGTRPGFSSANLTWEAKTTEVVQGESIFLFSDGIVTPGEPVSKWLKAIQRGLGVGKSSLAMKLLNSIRSNRSTFRKDRSHEDDMSLIILKRL